MGDKLRVVLAGCGGMSGTWFRVATQMETVEMVGVVDIREDAARKRAEEYHLQNAVIGTDLKTVLDETSPDIVFDCTIPEAHVHVTLEALKHGCHVLVKNRWPIAWKTLERWLPPPKSLENSTRSFRTGDTIQEFDA